MSESDPWPDSAEPAESYRQLVSRMFSLSQELRALPEGADRASREVLLAQIDPLAELVFQHPGRRRYPGGPDVAHTSPCSCPTCDPANQIGKATPGKKGSKR